MNRQLTRRSLWVVCCCVWSLPAHAGGGPPFMTDDPETVPFRHYEAYAFSVVDHSGDTTFPQLPAFEFNIGAAPNLQLHIVVPGAYSGLSAYGLGDVELGVKYRFLQEGNVRPQVGVFPMIELPTGDSHAGLGNGTVWARLPVWVQKSLGRWTTYGGVGYQVNRAPGMKDSLFAGWQVQRKLSQRLTLGAESYHIEAQAKGGQQSTFLDGGGYYNVRENISLLFMAGHTVSGTPHAIGYLGFYSTWGGSQPTSSMGPRLPRPLSSASL